MTRAWCAALLLLCACGGPAFTVAAEVDVPSEGGPFDGTALSSSLPEGSASTEPPSDGGALGDASDVAIETSVRGAVDARAEASVSDASSEASPDAGSAYARCVAAFVAACSADPSACASVSVMQECGSPP